MHELYLFYTLAAERGGASSGEGVQDGRPRRLSPCGLRPDEAVLDSGLRNAALLPDAEGKAAAYQSQGALPVKRRWSGGIWGRGGGESLYKAHHSYEVDEEGPVGCHTMHSSPLTLPASSASTKRLFLCLCCIAFARQFPLLSKDHCFFLTLPAAAYFLSFCRSLPFFFVPSPPSEYEH